MTPVLAAEAAAQPLKKNGGRASSHLELVERENPLEAAVVSKTGSKIGWKMKTFIGTSLALNALYALSLASDYGAKKGAEAQAQVDSARLNSTTPPSSAGRPPQQNYGSSPGYSQPQTYGNPANQQTSTGQSTNPPSTNYGPNSRREERPLDHKLGRRSPVDIPKARSFSDNVRRTSSDLGLLNRADLGEALSLFGRMLDKLD